MPEKLILLSATAAFLGFVHTLVGPDHYLPFIVLAKTRNWTKLKTLFVVILCGIGHILSSILIGFVGIAFGIALFSLEAIENTRGEIAAWLFIAFGLVYTVWGIRQAYKNKPHKHLHFHPDGSAHEHDHSHHTEHSHLHESDKRKITPWVLFVIFVFGPCEPLIPLVMYPAATHNYFAVGLVSAIFGAVTIVTMLSVTFLGLYGINLVPMNKVEKHIHTLAGLTILLCGVGIKFLGL